MFLLAYTTPHMAEISGAEFYSVRHCGGPSGRNRPRRAYCFQPAAYGSPSKARKLPEMSSVAASEPSLADADML